METPTLIEVIGMERGRYTVSVWFGLRMESEIEVTSLAGAVEYLAARFASSSIIVEGGK